MRLESIDWIAIGEPQLDGHVVSLPCAHRETFADAEQRRPLCLHELLRQPAVSALRPTPALADAATSTAVSLAPDCTANDAASSTVWLDTTSSLTWTTRSRMAVMAYPCISAHGLA